MESRNGFRQEWVELSPGVIGYPPVTRRLLEIEED